ncbi:MAG: YajQ family cyclic di-GMP-binding protein [Candidatus Eremiobacteraeota bacterium]|nr:YajQ family cyclic di-GMP-binding protein [Candidatus Eremiobacteraeota bacterium]
MADFSFDVVSRVDAQELDNALNQTRKEIEGRFDFKHSKTTVEHSDKTITILTDDALKLKNVVDILQSRANKRGISLKSFEFGKVEPAAGNAVRQVVTVKSGIAKDKSKPLVEAIKAAKLKVTTQYQDEQLRVSGKSKDDLQKAQALLKGLDIDLPLQFVNYR